MNRKQSNLLNMGHALTKTLASIVATNPAPALVAKADAFKAKLAEIEAQAAIQALPTTGKTVDRDKVFAVAIDATLVVADLVRGYARTQGSVISRPRFRSTLARSRTFVSGIAFRSCDRCTTPRWRSSRSSARPA